MKRLIMGYFLIYEDKKLYMRTKWVSGYLNSSIEEIKEIVNEQTNEKLIAQVTQDLTYDNEFAVFSGICHNTDNYFNIIKSEELYSIINWEHACSIWGLNVENLEVSF